MLIWISEEISLWLLLILPHQQIIIASSLKYKCLAIFFLISFPSFFPYILLSIFLLTQPFFQVSVTLFTLSHPFS